MFKKDIETILDEAIQQLRRGKTVEQVLAIYPSEAQTLAPLLGVVADVAGLPKQIVPAPRKQYKFIGQRTPAAQPFWSLGNIFAFGKLAAFPLSLLIALTGTVSAIHFVKTSLPGETFFAVKKATEQLPLALTSNSNQLAHIQLELTQKRLAEAETVINSSAGDTNSKVAALNELSAQTKHVLESVKQAATKKQIEPDDKTLFASLDSIGTKQEALIQEINKTDTPAVIAASKESQDAVASLRKIVAASNDGTLAALPVTVTGDVTAISKTSITVDTQIFEITDKTTVSKDKKFVALETIILKMRVTVTGDNLDGKVLAKEIIILDNNSVSGTEKVKKPVIPETNKIETPIEQPEPVQDEQVLKAGFIPEDPAPQLVH